MTSARRSDNFPSQFAVPMNFTAPATFYYRMQRKRAGKTKPTKIAICAPTYLKE